MGKKNNLNHWLKRILVILFGFIVVILVILIFGYYLLSHPPKYKLSFEIDKQKLIDCNNKQIYSLSIENDSVTKTGGVYEMGRTIVWDNKEDSAPFEISFENIPKGYSLFGYKNKIPISKLILRPNCSYTIEEYGKGNVNFKIRVWTDKNGKVFKTTHPDCSSNKSLEE